jgi:hypothetical protein
VTKAFVSKNGYYWRRVLFFCQHTCVSLVETKSIRCKPALSFPINQNFEHPPSHFWIPYKVSKSEHQISWRGGIAPGDSSFSSSSAGHWVSMFFLFFPLVVPSDPLHVGPFEGQQGRTRKPSSSRFNQDILCVGLVTTWLSSYTVGAMYTLALLATLLNPRNKKHTYTCTHFCI